MLSIAHNTPVVPELHDTAPGPSTMASQGGGMAEAMRAALASRTPSPASDADQHKKQVQAQLFVINAQLDKEFAAEPSSEFYLLRHYNGQSSTGDFHRMVKFASSEWQMFVRWRNCGSHKARLAKIDLSDPKKALESMATEIQRDNEGHYGRTAPRLGQPAQTVATNFLHPNSAGAFNPRLKYVSLL